MSKFRVAVKEVYEQMYEVEADNAEQAKQILSEAFQYKAKEKEGIVTFLEDEFDFAYMLDSDQWAVYDK